jgi:signal transduction histidine kinase
VVDATGRRAGDTRRMKRRNWAFDLTLATLVGLGCTLEVWAARVFGSTNMAGPRVAVFLSYMLAVAALVVRRRHPLESTVIIATALSIEWLAFGAPEGFGVFATLILAGYTVAAYADRGRALAGLAVLILTAVVWSARDPVQTDIHRHLTSSVWLSPVVIAWLFGAYLRTRRLYVVQLQERAARAEHEREERAEAAVLSERARIARELHDILAHNVSVMVVQAEAADEMLDRDMPDRARMPVWKIQETGRLALADMRRMLGILREVGSQPIVTPQPGIANLELLLAKVRESGLPVDLEVSGAPEELPPGIDLSAYRIVQEALTNSLRYAGPARARVVVRFAPGSLELEIEDDGAGAPTDGPAGHGLIGMRERVALFGGQLEVGPKAEGGYRVCAQLPLETVG